MQFHQQVPDLKKKVIREKLERVLGDLGCRDKELSILFTDDGCMADLNRRYLGREGPTNVLAFPMMNADPHTDQSPDIDTGLLGDVAISLDTAQREAQETGETLEETVERLLIHGILHLLGHDHVGDRTARALMEREEERLIALLKEG
ncbi:MAG: rRNA maturation RNase YbeY [Deltaproteobacteria bacterium]|nr:rRNA maturation RNase YbeY [Deltaproteobacteria bacterium]